MVMWNVSQMFAVGLFLIRMNEEIFVSNILSDD